MVSQELYELPEGWKWAGWNDALEIIGGKNQKDVVADDGQYAIYGSGGEMGRATKFLCPAYTTIIGRKGTINKPQYIEEPFWNVDTAFGLAPNEQLDTKLFFYFCCSFNFLTLNRSTTLPSLTKRDLYTLKIPLPPLNEQKRIVAKLDALFTRIDTAITHLQQTLELSKALFASETNIAFEKVSTKHGTASLSQLVQINSGIALPKIFKDWKASGSISFYKVAQMNNDNRIMKDAAITFDSNIALTHRIKLFPKGSVLIPKRGGAIITDKKRLLLEDASYDSNIMGLKADEKNITDEYLFRLLLSINLGDYIDTAVIPQINNKHIARMQIPLAPIKEQEIIVAHLDAFSERTHTLEASTQEKINDLTALKASLLDAAFKGQL